MSVVSFQKKIRLRRKSLAALGRSSLGLRLTGMFLLVALLPVGVLAVVSYSLTRASLVDLALSKVEQEAALTAADTRTFMDQFFTDILVLSDLPPVQGLVRARDNQGLDPLTGEAVESWTNRLQQTFTTMVQGKQFYRGLFYLDETGREVVRVDYQDGRVRVASEDEQLQTELLLRDRSEADYFTEARLLSAGEVYISPITLSRDEVGRLEVSPVPLIHFSSPVYNQAGEVRGVVVSSVNAASFLNRLQADRGTIYLTNAAGYYLFHPEAARTFGFEREPADNIATDFPVPYAAWQASDRAAYTAIDQEQDLVIALQKVRFDPRRPERYWLLAWTLPAAAALGPVQTQRTLVGGLVLVTIGLTSLLALGLVRRVTRPLLQLREAAEQVGRGNLEIEVPIEAEDEIGLLTRTFNELTWRLRETLETAARRSQRLAMAAVLGERLSTSLELERLVAEAINQIKEHFGYYHAQIYLVDETGERLVAAEGTGEAGRLMKERRSYILLSDAASLVARAARTGEVVKVDDVRDVPAWQPNPLVPETRSEAAIPIMLGESGQVVGVLDIQQDRLAGLDEEDVYLLRSLVNYVAVAIHNRRLFAEVETAVAEARAVQEYYVERSWKQANSMGLSGAYHYARPDAPALDEQTVAAVKRQGVDRRRAAIVAVKGSAPASESETEARTSIVAPVTLRDKIIGALQLHPAYEDQTWTEDDLAIVQAVVNQLAQTAENLRLFEETRERAGREQTIREITDKLRSASSLNALLETTVRELGQHLGVRHTVLELGIDQSPEPGDQVAAGAEPVP